MDFLPLHILSSSLSSRDEDSMDSLESLSPSFPVGYRS